MAIEWAKEWLSGLAERKLLAKFEWDRGRIRPFNPDPRTLQGSTFMCNICRQTKTATLFGVAGDEYSSRYYCHTCCVEIGVAW